MAHETLKAQLIWLIKNSVPCLSSISLQLFNISEENRLVPRHKITQVVVIRHELFYASDPIEIGFWGSSVLDQILHRNKPRKRRKKKEEKKPNLKQTVNFIFCSSLTKSQQCKYNNESQL